MLIDEVTITLEAGHGGPGKVSFYPGLKSGPDGGNGGKGGDIYITATSDLTALNQFAGKKYLKAEDGDKGDSFRKAGKDGKDLTISMPVGSLLNNTDTGEVVELTEPGHNILICRGGKGGRGNFELKSARRTTPEYAQKGLPGDKITFEIQLRLIADFGLIGLPNAGKSSLLNELTEARVKTADYPFTTLEPNLGTSKGKIIADIPGLIEGAAEGRGLGIKFLKHIEKVSLLLHCIAVDSANVLSDYQVVINELQKFNSQLLDKKEIIILTKSDTVSKKELLQKQKQLKSLKKEIIPVSIYDFDSIEKIKAKLFS